MSNPKNETQAEKEVREYDELTAHFFLADPPDHQGHLKAVVKWVDENIEIHPACSHVTLFNFQITDNGYDERQFFSIKFGEFESGYRITFIRYNKKLKMLMPMFHSPLGAPGSYRAIDTSDDEEKAINFALNHISLSCLSKEMKMRDFNHAITVEIKTLEVYEQP